MKTTVEHQESNKNNKASKKIKLLDKAQEKKQLFQNKKQLVIIIQEES